MSESNNKACGNLGCNSSQGLILGSLLMWVALPGSFQTMLKMWLGRVAWVAGPEKESKLSVCILEKNVIK